jgi:hypothetical protein
MHQENTIPCIRAGQVRRDCEPHHGPLLQLLGAASVVLGVLSVCVLLPSLVGFPLGVGVWRMARQDLEKMHLGRMDPDGRHETEDARAGALNGMLACVLAWCLWGFVLYHLWHPWGPFR